MGDRTNVSLCILKEDEAEIESLLGYFDGKITEELFTEYDVTDVNYGNLDITETCIKKGIPFSFEWGAGYSYGPGTCNLRFDDNGIPMVVEYPFDYLQINVKIVNGLLQDFNTTQDPTKIVKYLSDKTSNLTILPWKDQLRNRDIYKTKLLLDPDFHEKTRWTEI